MFYVSFAGLGIGLGLERAGLGLGLDLEGAGLGLGLGLVTAGLDYDTASQLFCSCEKVYHSGKCYYKCCVMVFTLSVHVTATQARKRSDQFTERSEELWRLLVSKCFHFSKLNTEFCYLAVVVKFKIKIQQEMLSYGCVCVCVCFVLAVLRAFADVETVESMHALARGSSVVQLSVQEMLDCSYKYDGILWSCSGGDTCYALDWMKQVCTVGLTALYVETVIFVA